MSNVAKLKKRALDYEQKKQFDKALETYVQILSELDDHVDEADVALYNRVGDLMLRRGDVGAAVDHYERAVDLYTEGGFFNNAIALCNKILRNAPGRSTVYYKLGKISAKKGFINDAKQNFLEYADRMQRTGELEEAFRALKEFADLCPDQDDIRLMLADQLVRKDRKTEAVEQLQLLYDKFQSEGRTREARATVDRMKAIDPELEPKAGTMRPTPKANDLIFLDVNYDEPVAGARGRAAPPPPAVQAPPVPSASPPEPTPIAADPPRPDAVLEREVDLPPLVVESDVDAAIEPPPGLSSGASVPGDRPDTASGLVSHLDAGLITGFEQTTFGAGELEGSADAIAPFAELEPTGLGDTDLSGFVPLSGMEDVTIGALGEGEEPPLGGLQGDDGMLPDVSLDADEPFAASDAVLDAGADADAEASIGGDLTFIVPADEPSAMPPANDRDADEPGPPLELIYVVGDDESAPAGSGAVDEIDLEEIGGNLIFLEPTPEQGAAAVGADAPAAQPAPSPLELLRARVAASPDDGELRRRLAESLFEAGDRAGGLAELEAAMLGFERAGSLRSASAVAEELIRVDPGEVRHHQKRVEYAVRANDKSRLVDAYISLAESLLNSGQLDKSRAVYARVLELAPDEARALSALRSLGPGSTGVPTPPEAARPAPPPVREGPAAPPAVREMPAAREAPVARQTPAATSAPRAAAAPAPHASGERPAATPGSDDEFVNLSDWLREDETTKSTRMVVDVAEPVDQAQVDFSEMLAMFKQGVAENVEETDHESHYDLGVAYKEMGLLDEAISEFQKALRGTEQRVRTYEALGQCFVEKQQYQIALTILSRALSDKTYTDDMLVGVLYLLGYASEALGRFQDAMRFYERVFAVDIQFRDIGDRLATVEARAR